MNNFNPNWASPPGDTIKEILEEREWCEYWFAIAMGYDKKFMEDLYKGVTPLTLEIANKLEKILGSSTEFWLKREEHFRESVKRLGLENIYEKVV